MNQIYFDYAATTPLDLKVKAAMEPYWSGEFGNPGSLHSFGQKASAAVFKARQTIAGAIGAHYSEIIFTGSATEANNLALSGAVQYFKKNFPKIKPRVIISAIEHDCVREVAKSLVQWGVEVVVIPVSKEGIVDINRLKAALSEETALVSVMYANNEVGTVQPIEEIGKIIREVRGQKLWPLFHTDAVQALQYLNCNVADLGVDLMTLSGHKVYGPKGIGVLYARKAKSLRLLEPQILGGGQEEGLRSGTENVPLIVGMAKAVEVAQENREKESKRISGLQTSLTKEIKKVWPGAQLNGSPKNRLPNNVHIYFPKKSGEELMVSLDLKGISVATGPACSARTAEPSHVLLAMGYSKERAMSSLRITLGRLTTKAEIEKFISALKDLRK